MATEELSEMVFSLQSVLKLTKILSWVLMGPKTKNDCAGEGQQQITR
jgi:hypothetical protein